MQKKPYIVSYGSQVLKGRNERRKAKQELRRGNEPAPKYTTGKFWVD